MKVTPAVYLATLELENVRCFRGRQELDLTVAGHPAQWSILIGENGAGKTTLLESLAWMCPVPDEEDSSSVTTETEEVAPLTDGKLTSALPRADNEILETFPRDMAEHVKLRAKLEFGGVGFHSGVRSESEKRQSARIETGVDLTFNRMGKLLHLDSTKSTRVEDLPQPFHDPLIVTYGANRYLGKHNLREFYESTPFDYRRLLDVTELCDVEELLMALDYSARSNSGGLETRVLHLLRNAISRILPEEPAVEIAISPPDVLGTGRPGGVYARTFTGLVRMSALSLGYRSTAGWVVDFASRLFQRYPNSPDPLSEPAVVLIDEIDLHLHPLWQIQIIEELSTLFPATQFIATSHSPLIVQVAGDSNLILLKKQEGEVQIENDPNISRNLRVDQILTSSLFGIPSSRSPEIQSMLDERAELLGKMNRTEIEENRLQEIRQTINRLPVADDPDDREAMDLIRLFAASLEEREDGS